MTERQGITLSVRRRWVLAGVVFLVAAGVAFAFAPKTTPDTEPAPTAAAPAATTVAAPPPAADGSDVAACQDGDCEVRVDAPAAIPLDPRFGLADLRVASVAPESVAVEAAVVRGAGFDVQCVGPTPPACPSSSMRMNHASDTEPAVLQINGTTGYRVRLPALVIDTVAVQHGVAVLRLGPPDAVDGGDLGACLDGTCTVRIGGPVEIPLDPRFGMRAGIRVVSVAAEAVVVSATPEDGSSVRFWCGDRSADTCPTTSEGGTVESALVLAGHLRFAEITVDVAVLDQDGAVLRLAPVDPGTPPGS